MNNEVIMLTSSSGAGTPEDVTFRVNSQSASYVSVPATTLAGGWLGRANNTFL